MNELPKLVVEIRNFEQIRHLDKVFFWGDNLLSVEGQLIESYEALLQLANQEQFKKKGYLEGTLDPLVGGG